MKKAVEMRLSPVTMAFVFTLATGARVAGGLPNQNVQLITCMDALDAHQSWVSVQRIIKLIKRVCGGKYRANNYCDAA